MIEELAYLSEALDLAVVKRETVQKVTRTASIAYAKSGAKYRGANVESATSLLAISSEQAALAGAAAATDYKIERVVTVVDEPDAFTVSPLVLKVLIDFAIRSKECLTYRVVGRDGSVIFETDDVATVLPFYRQTANDLSKITNGKPQTTSMTFDAAAPKAEQLKRAAVMGIERCFPTYESATGYGAAVLADDTIYFSGQYGSFEKRTNLHAEMSAVVLALMDGKKKIDAIGIASSKFKNEPCEICGCCRQFLAEMAAKQGADIKCFCFARDTDAFEQYALQELLPHQWNSKKWA